jgi:hypothetical protein
MAGRSSFGVYLKAAFGNRWNLLALFGASAAAIISGQADVLLPLVAAVELAFLGVVSTRPRFHRAVDAQRGAMVSARGARSVRERFRELYQGLDPRSRERFDELKARCETFRDLAGKGGSPSELGLESVAQENLAGINRLLWVFLKLLYTKVTLERFFESINPDELDRSEREARRRIEELPKGGADPMIEKKRMSIEDTLKTASARRENIKRARENHDYVSLELDRIAAKLSAMAELAVNRQDPGLLTHDVDDVARSVQATEEAIGELQSYTGLTAEDLSTPEILAPQPLERVRG